MTARPSSAETKRTVTAASVGTLFEWYDFNLYALLTLPIGLAFFSGFPETTRAVFALLLFAVGFFVRPLGAIFFGRISDRIGRKITFLITVVIMGVATVAVGLLPGYATLGWWAPVLLVILRMAQGFAVGGEYAGAAVFLAEHVETDRRGFYTSFLQATITMASLIALILIVLIRDSITEAQFLDWGWRIPFLLAIFPLFLSVWIRLRLKESPVFLHVKDAGKVLSSPLRAVFSDWGRLRLMLVILFGLVAGQAVLAYGGQVYPFIFMQSVLKLDFLSATIFQAWALAVAVLGFVVFGWLADIVGRKTVIVAGLFLGVTTYFPLFNALTHAANPALASARANTEILVLVPRESCSFQFNPTGGSSIVSACDRLNALLIARGASYEVRDADEASVSVNGIGVMATDPALSDKLSSLLAAAGYPAASEPSIAKVAHPLEVFQARYLTMLGILCLLALYGSMVYAPLAALLVELFPANVRTTAMSIPYNIGNGWIGGLLPATSVALVFHTGDIYSGLWYPVGFAVVSLIVCTLFVPETFRRFGFNPARVED